MASPEFAHWLLQVQAIVDGEALGHPTDADTWRSYFNADYTPRQAVQAKGPSPAAALTAVADYVTAHADGWVRNGPNIPSLAEQASKQDRIKAVACEIKKLADTSNVTYQQFDPLLQQLHRLGAFPTNDLVSDVGRVILSPMWGGR